MAGVFQRVRESPPSASPPGPRSVDPPSLLGTLYALMSVAAVDLVPPALLALVALMLFPGLVLARRPQPALYRQLWGIASLLFIGLMVGAHLLLGMASALVLVFICLFLLLHRWFNGRGAREHLEIWCLGALLLLVGCLRGGGILGLIVLAGWAVSSIQVFNLLAVLRTMPGGVGRETSPYAFATHSMRGVWGMIPVSLLAGTAIFYLLPRIIPPAGQDGSVRIMTPAERSIARAGYSDTVDLRGLSSIRETDAVAFRVIDPPPQIVASQVRFRMTVHDEFTGWEWKRHAGAGDAVALRQHSFRIPAREGEVDEAPSASMLHWYYIRLENLPGHVMPMPETAVSLAGFAGDSDLQMEGDGRISIRKGTIPREYQVLANAFPKTTRDNRLLRGAVLPEHTRIPEELRPALEAAADRMIIRPDEPPAGISRQVNSWLRRNGVYTLDLDQPEDGPAALERFLGMTPSGHCELFATAMAMVLRTRGIPTRLVAGFSGSDTAPSLYGDNKEDLVVRHRNAHAWVEAYDPEHGWMTFDPTPPPPLTTTPEIAGGGWKGFLSENARMVASMIEGYDQGAQQAAVSSARQRMVRWLRNWEGGALFTVWTRLQTNVREPAILALAGLLAALNATAWWMHLFGRRGRQRRMADRLSSPGTRPATALLAEILESLEYTGRDHATGDSPRQAILEAARRRGLPAEKARTLADLYNQWRFGEGGRALERQIRQHLRTMSPGPA